MLLTMAQLSVSADLIFMSRSEKIVQSLPQAKVAFERYLDNMYGANRLAGNEYTDRYRKIIEEFIAGAFLFGLIYYFCQLFMVIIAATILIKHVFDVMNKNKEVMTLFAMIEKEQIEKLKLECEDFRRNHLPELSNQNNNSESVTLQPTELKTSNNNSKKEKEKTENNQIEVQEVKLAMDSNISINNNNNPPQVNIELTEQNNLDKINAPVQIENSFKLPL